MTTGDKLPAWAKAGRAGWTWTGAARPPFAIEPGPGQESVWDYPRPPALVPDEREVIVRLDGVELARTRGAVRLLETSHPPSFYLPRADVRLARLVPAGGGSRCEWKGACTYYDVVVGDQRVPRAAWSYLHPFDDAATIAGHVAFYPARLECLVDGERARPQPGGFYGGWITSELVGPWKGDPATSGW
ncbi:MAG: DUF427 domain-containing protein [Kofleriaceae bacterium]